MHTCKDLSDRRLCHLWARRLRRGTEQQLAAAQERAAEAEARAAAAVADLQTARAIANAASDRGAVEVRSLIASLRKRRV